VELQREELVRLMRQVGANRAELCRRFGVSRATGYKWLAREEEGFWDRSRRPLSSPLRTDEQREALIVSARHERPQWGARKLRRFLENQGHEGLPCPSTITAVLSRHDLLGERAGVPRDCVRFEKPAPNDLWQMDFKGHFGLHGSGRCHPFTLLDDHSRYGLCIRAYPGEETLYVKEALTEAFRTYGLPRSILCDNGSPWGSDSKHGLTPLGAWLLLLEIDVCHGRPYHPQTQGKLERFHQTLRVETLQGRSFADLAECQNTFDQFRHDYNLLRPHESLDMEVPAARYRPSPRSFPNILPEPEYAPQDVVRKVHDHGRISFHGWLFDVPKALKGYRVGIRTTATDGLYDIWFCAKRIGQINLRTDKNQDNHV
jgi:transposase InsO family protein